MRLYLLRHGKAHAEYEDPRRALAPAGRDQVRHVARQAHARGLRVERILASTLQRAEESALAFLRELGDLRPPEIVAGLLPADPVLPWAERLADEDRDTLVVGHNPFLEELVRELVPGHAEEFGTGSLVALERGPDGDWSILYTLDPPRPEVRRSSET